MQNNLRVLFKKRGCPYCKTYLTVIQRINSRLPPDKRIRIIDITHEDKYNLKIPLLEKVTYGGVPLLILDGIKIEGMTTRSYAEEMVYQLVKEDLLL